MSAKWKTPDDYLNLISSTCDFETREEKGCTEFFYNSGFLKDSKWDRYAEYEALCRNCPHYVKGCGIYFGDGRRTDGLREREIVECLCCIKTAGELKKAAEAFGEKTKVMIFEDIRTQDLSALEVFPGLECVLINYCPNLIRFWDFSKTPKLKVLTYMSNNVLNDLAVLNLADNLEYLGIETLPSRTALMYVDSFRPLTGLPSLKELSLNAVSCRDDDIDALIEIPALEKLWISPHAFSTNAFARFEALKFKIYAEYGIYENGEDCVRGLGKGRAAFRSQAAKAGFMKEYAELMSKAER